MYGINGYLSANSLLFQIYFRLFVSPSDFITSPVSKALRQFNGRGTGHRAKQVKARGSRLHHSHTNASDMFIGTLDPSQSHEDNANRRYHQVHTTGNNAVATATSMRCAGIINHHTPHSNFTHDARSNAQAHHPSAAITSTAASNCLRNTIIYEDCNEYKEGMDNIATTY